MRFWISECGFESYIDNQLVYAVIVMIETCPRSTASSGERQAYTLNSVRTGVLLNKQWVKNKHRGNYDSANRIGVV